MELNFEHKTSTVYRKLAHHTVKDPISIELIVPDGNEDIAGILTVRAMPLLKSKELTPGGVQVSGELQSVLFYIEEGGKKLAALTFTRPFVLEFAVPEMELDLKAQVRLSIGGTEARALNPRKLSVTCEILGELDVYQRNEISVDTCLPETQQRFHVKTAEIPASTIALVSEKTFVINEQCLFPPDQPIPERLLTQDLQYTALSTQQIGNRMIVKGELELRLLYSAENEAAPLEAHFRIPFSQLLDTDCNVDQCVISIQTTSAYLDLITAISGERAVDLEIHALLQATGYQQSLIRYVEDAYSNSLPVRCRYEDRKAEQVSAVKQLSLRGETELETGDGDAELLYTFVSPGLVSRDDDQTRAVMNAVFLFQDQTGSLTASRRSILLSGESLPGEILWMDSEAAELSVTRQEDRLLCEGTMGIQILSSETKRFSAVTDLEEEGTAEASGPLPSVTLVRTEGESLWQLAKQYHSSVESITALNDLSAQQPGEMLLIPREY